MDRQHLRGFERVSVPVMEHINSRPAMRTLLHASVGAFNAAWIEATTGPMWRLSGLEHALQLQAPRGLILVSNHRSFFDMFVIGTVLKRRTRLLKHVTFPVRSEFFYTHPLGLLLNVSISGASMWPPVFRDERRRTLNPTGWQQLATTLGPGAVVGMHPEGTRGKGPDPYAFLPLKPGLGQLLDACDPEVRVLPAFIAGLSNDIVREVRRGLLPSAQRGEPIRIRFGAPVRAAEVHGLEPGVATEQVFAPIRELAEQDRAEREAGAW